MVPIDGFSGYKNAEKVRKTGHFLRNDRFLSGCGGGI
jgi:hypothetical protein